MRSIILASQRSGSTFLAKCLNSHPQVRCPNAELFLPDSWADRLRLAWQAGGELDRYFARGLIPPRVLEAHRRNKPPWAPWEELDDQELVPVMMTKIMHNQMLGCPSLHHYVLSHTDIRVIHLRRANLLKQHVSNMLTRRSKELSRPPHATEPVRPAAIRIRPRVAIWHMRLVRALHNWYSRRLSRHPRIEVVYETLIEANRLSDEASTLICDLLGLEPEPLGANLVKVNPDSLRDIVTNYDELVRALTGTEFEEFLE
jgi:LPS sulfotransferase NodH